MVLNPLIGFNAHLHFFCLLKAEGIKLEDLGNLHLSLELKL